MLLLVVHARPYTHIRLRCNCCIDWLLFRFKFQVSEYLRVLKLEAFISFQLVFLSIGKPLLVILMVEILRTIDLLGPNLVPFLEV